MVRRKSCGLKKCWVFLGFQRLQWADSLGILLASGSTSTLNAGCYISYKTKQLSPGIGTYLNFNTAVKKKKTWFQVHTSFLPFLTWPKFTAFCSLAHAYHTCKTAPILPVTHSSFSFPIKTTHIFLNYPLPGDSWQAWAAATMDSPSRASKGTRGLKMTYAESLNILIK